MAILEELTKLFKIKLKQRSDDLLDQYNRLFMMRLFLAVTLVCGMTWYKNDFNCHIPKSMKLGDDFKKFVHRNCWIQGLYIYRELKHHKADSAYFGITKDIDFNGVLAKNGKLCQTVQRLSRKKSEECTQMEKTFFLQYQYLPFYLAFLAVLYYLPYLMYKYIYTKVLKLQSKLKSKQPDSKTIFKQFFNNGKFWKDNETGRTACTLESWSKYRILVIKIFYLAVNFFALLSLNCILEGWFFGYGKKWIDWAKRDDVNEDVIGFDKPANELLPPVGYCEIFASAQDIRRVHVDKFKFVCEISQHVLYQYALLLIWFSIIVGICVSLLGVLYALWRRIVAHFNLRALRDNDEDVACVYQHLANSHVELMEELRASNYVIFREVLTMFLNLMKEKKQNRSQLSCNASTAFTLPATNPHQVESTSSTGPSKRKYELVKDAQLMSPPSYQDRDRKYTMHDQTDLVMPESARVSVAVKSENPVDGTNRKATRRPAWNS